MTIIPVPLIPYKELTVPVFVVIHPLIATTQTYVPPTHVTPTPEVVLIPRLVVMMVFLVLWIPVPRLRDVNILLDLVVMVMPVPRNIVTSH
jgi:hypothetical protein